MKETKSALEIAVSEEIVFGVSESLNSVSPGDTVTSDLEGEESMLSSELVSSELTAEPFLTKNFEDYTSSEFFLLSILACLVILVFLNIWKGGK